MMPTSLRIRQGSSRRAGIVLFALATTVLVATAHRYSGRGVRGSASPSAESAVERPVSLPPLPDTELLLPQLPMCVEEDAAEKTWSAALAHRLGGRVEVQLPAGRADVVTERFAIEVERLTKWKEGVGQSLYYAQATGKRPALALILPSADAPTALSEIERLCVTEGIRLLLLRRDCGSAQGVPPFTPGRQGGFFMIHDRDDSRSLDPLLTFDDDHSFEARDRRLLEAARAIVREHGEFDDDNLPAELRLDWALHLRDGFAESGLALFYGVLDDARFEELWRVAGDPESDCDFTSLLTESETELYDSLVESWCSAADQIEDEELGFFERFWGNFYFKAYSIGSFRFYYHHEPDGGDDGFGIVPVEKRGGARRRRPRRGEPMARPVAQLGFHR